MNLTMISTDGIAQNQMVTTGVHIWLIMMATGMTKNVTKKSTICVSMIKVCTDIIYCQHSLCRRSSNTFNIRGPGKCVLLNMEFQLLIKNVF